MDELGSGVRNTFKYAAIYSEGRNPVFEEGDVFRCIIPIGGTGLMTATGNDHSAGSDQESDQVNTGRELAHELKDPRVFEKWLKILADF